MLKPLVTKEMGHPRATVGGSGLLLIWAGVGTCSIPKKKARCSTLPWAAHTGGKGPWGPLQFFTSRPHSLIGENPPSSQPCLGSHLSPMDCTWVGEFLLFWKVSCLTSWHSPPTVLSCSQGLGCAFGQGCHRPALSPPCWNLDRLLMMPTWDDWLSLKTDCWAPP